MKSLIAQRDVLFHPDWVQPHRDSSPARSSRVFTSAGFRATATRFCSARKTNTNAEAVDKTVCHADRTEKYETSRNIVFDSDSRVEFGSRRSNFSSSLRYLWRLFWPLLIRAPDLFHHQISSERAKLSMQLVLPRVSLLLVTAI